jgi:hypothetical protein
VTAIFGCALDGSGTGLVLALTEVLAGALTGAFATDLAGVLTGALATGLTAFLAGAFAVGLVDAFNEALGNGLAGALEADLAGALPAGFAAGLEAGLGVIFLAAGFLAAGLVAGLAAGFALTVGFATGFAGTFFATGLAAGLAAGLALALTGLLAADLLTTFDFFAGAFTSCLLAVAAWALSESTRAAAPFGFIPLFRWLTDLASARDCSDLPAPIPIILKNTSIKTASKPKCHHK